MSPMPGAPGPYRKLDDLMDMPRQPGMSHMRRQMDRANREAPPQASFPNRLSAFLRHQVFGWVGAYLKNFIRRKHKFLTYETTSQTGVYPLAAGEEVRVSMCGDWGTGTREAFEVAERMMESDPHYTIHLGDIYYVGGTEEVSENCLGVSDEKTGAPGLVWPIGSTGSFALNANHEMYANGDAYFDLFLPKLGVRPQPGAPPSGQAASYFCLQNEWWSVIGLDTGYNSVGWAIIEYIFRPNARLEKALLEWLKESVQPKTNGRALVLLSHHQYYSAFESQYPKAADQLADMIDRPVLWFWGHEHRMAAYGAHRVDGGITAFGRCLGHGGMPVDIRDPIVHPEFPPALYDDRRYPDLFSEPVGYNGFANLRFNGNRLAVEYKDLRGNVILSEEWESREGRLHGIDIRPGIADPDIKIGDLNAAIGRPAALGARSGQ